jgi:hypothetical protein
MGIAAAAVNPRGSFRTRPQKDTTTSRAAGKV